MLILEEPLGGAVELYGVKCKAGLPTWQSVQMQGPKLVDLATDYLHFKLQFHLEV